MSTNVTLLLTLLSVTLLALEQAARLSTWPEWLQVPAVWRAVAVLVIGAGVGITQKVMAGVTWGQAALALAIVTVPAIVKVVFYPEAPAAKPGA